MEKQLRFINVLGYKVKKIHDTRWVILNEKDKKIGYIQYKKICNKDIKKNIPAKFGYVTKIESDNVKYDDTTPEVQNFETYNGYLYCFNSFKNGNSDYIEMNLSSNPSLTIWSELYGYMNFFINSHELFFNFKSSTKKHNIEETINYKLSNYYDDKPNEEYTYVMSTCKKGKDIDNRKGRKTYELSAKAEADEALSLNEKYWSNGKLIKQYSTECNSTISEMITVHQMAIESFNLFRRFIKEILPFKEDIIDVMLKDFSFKSDNLKLFLTK